MEDLPPEEGIKYLDGVQRVGEGKWIARCPMPDHDDRKASLSIARGSRRALLLKCFGCSATFRELLHAIDARRWGVR